MFDLDKYYKDLLIFVEARPDNKALEETLLTKEMVNTMIPNAQSKIYKCKSIPKRIYHYFPFLTKDNGINMRVNFTNSLRHCNSKDVNSRVSTKTLVLSPSVMFFTDNGYYFPFEFHFSIDTKTIFPNASRLFNEVIESYPQVNTNTHEILCKQTITHLLDYFFTRLNPCNLLNIISTNASQIIPLCITQTIVDFNLSLKPIERLHINYKRYGSSSDNNKGCSLTAQSDSDAFKCKLDINSVFVCKYAAMQLQSSSRQDIDEILVANSVLKISLKDCVELTIKKQLLDITFKYINSFHNERKYRHMIQSGQLDFDMSINMITNAVDNTMTNTNNDLNGLLNNTSKFMSIMKEKIFPITTFFTTYSLQNAGSGLVVGTTKIDYGSRFNLIHSHIESVCNVKEPAKITGVLCYISNDYENMESTLPIVSSKHSLKLEAIPTIIHADNRSLLVLEEGMDSYDYSKLSCTIADTKYPFDTLKDNGFILMIFKKGRISKILMSSETAVTLFSKAPHLDIMNIDSMLTKVQSIDTKFVINLQEETPNTVNQVSLALHPLSLKR